MNTSMIKIEGLTFKYGKRASVFQDFSLEMEAGKVIGLFGQERYRKIYPVVSAERTVQGGRCTETFTPVSGRYVSGAGRIHTA